MVWWSNFKIRLPVMVYASMPEKERPAGYQLVGRVMAYQGDDG